MKSLYIAKDIHESVVCIANELTKMLLKFTLFKGVFMRIYNAFHIVFIIDKLFRTFIYILF